MRRTAGTGVRIAVTVAAVAVAVLSLTIAGALAGIATESAGTCKRDTSTPVSLPAAGTATAGQIVRYFVSQQIPAVAAAGIVGNLEQETSGINPAESDGAGGGGIAQWGGAWYAAMVAYASSQGLSPTSMEGQLAYIVFGLRSNAGGFIQHASLLAAMSSAPDPATAAEMFETGYERCSGVNGWMSVTPGSLCNDTARKQYAVQALGAAGGGAFPVSLPSAGCVTPTFAGSGTNPIPGFRPGRDDDGVDARATPGAPIVAPAPSTLVYVLANWYAGQPLLLFHFDQPVPGAYQQDAYWYVAEQITPVTLQYGAHFAQNQVVATYAQAGTGIEIGWGSPTTNSRTLAGGQGAHVAGGATTIYAETFRSEFGLPAMSA